MADRYPPITQQNFDEIFKDFCDRQPGKPKEPLILLPPQVAEEYAKLFPNKNKHGR